MLQQGLNFKCSFEDAAVITMHCDLTGTERLCNVSPEVKDTTEVHEECAPVPTANDFGLVFVGGHDHLCFMDFSLALR
jgi:hypothetical protein